VVAAGKAGAVKRYNLVPHTLVCMAVMVIEAGAIGEDNKVLVSLVALFGLLPHVDVYKTRILSPAAAAALLVNLTLITCEFTVPESIVAFVPNVPVNDQR
jgi:hypothetical protein